MLLFSDEFVAVSVDDASFNQAQAELLRFIRPENLPAAVEPYQLNHVLPKLHISCHMMWEKQYSSDRLWTNNNCESLNNVFKLELDWKPARLIDLVNHLHDLVKL